MSRDTVSKVFDIEGALETRSEKAAKWSDQRGETSHEEQMELIWHIGYRVDLARELRKENVHD